MSEVRPGYPSLMTETPKRDRSSSEELIAATLEALCSDESAGRRTGTPGGLFPAQALADLFCEELVAESPGTADLAEKIDRLLRSVS